ncbi:MAG: DMT family transporter [Pseudomonadales bacterium]|nr:DMT family transporter [Pseudomonadales bacterium]
MWISFTLLAAFMQSWRNAFQNQLSKQVSVTGVTLSRFLFATPLAGCYLATLYWWKPDTDLIQFNQQFVGYIIGASLMQILATVLMVKLFKQKNFSTGVGLAKSEALIAAVLGIFFFGTSLSVLGWIGVLVGSVAVFILSSRSGFRDISVGTFLIGLCCGGSFALTSLWVREASITSDLPVLFRAAWVLLFVLLIQTVILVIYIFLKERSTFSDLLHRPKLLFLTGFVGCAGSLGWFTAMSIQAVPYVKTLGQIEIFFSILLSIFWLKEKVNIKDISGLLLIGISAGLVIW